MSDKKHLTREELLQCIWIDPGRCFGKPCIRGHSIWVSLILDLLASGSTEQELLEDYQRWNPETYRPALRMSLKCPENATSTCHGNLSMKLKLDANLGERGRQVLARAGYEVETVPSQSLKKAADAKLIEHCRREKQGLVSLDLDFR